MLLEQYFKRIGYGGEVEPTLEVLDALMFAHSASIPFENISILNGEVISLDVQDIYKKIVIEKKGGYCFEQNNLFLEVLKKIGFNALPLAARVRVSLSSREEFVAKTHLLLKVLLGAKEYICDVGIGSYSLTKALELQDGLIQESLHDIRRFERVGDEWYMQVLNENDWFDVCQFNGNVFHEVDQKVANHYASTSKDIYFTYDLVTTIAKSDGARVTLRGSTLSKRYKDGKKEELLLTSKQSICEVLESEFGLGRDYYV